jgi:hypothetical protein
MTKDIGGGVSETLCMSNLLIGSSFIDEDTYQIMVQSGYELGTQAGYRPR